MLQVSLCYGDPMDEVPSGTARGVFGLRHGDHMQAVRLFHPKNKGNIWGTTGRISAHLSLFVSLWTEMLLETHRDLLESTAFCTTLTQNVQNTPDETHGGADTPAEINKASAHTCAHFQCCTLTS